jgi:hypothetical protein
VETRGGRIVAGLFARDLERFERADRVLVRGEQRGRRVTLRAEEIERVVVIELGQRLQEDLVEQRLAVVLERVEEGLLVGVALVQARVGRQFVVALREERVGLRDLIPGRLTGTDDLRDVAQALAQDEHALGACLQVQQRSGVIAIHCLERSVAHIETGDARTDHQHEQHGVAADCRDESAADSQFFSHERSLGRRPGAASGGCDFRITKDGRRLATRGDPRLRTN